MSNCDTLCAPLRTSANFMSACLVGKASHWDLVRSHFMSFRPASRAVARARWYTAIAAAVNAPADHQIKLQAAERKAAAAMPPVPSPESAAAPSAAQSPCTPDMAAASTHHSAALQIGSAPLAGRDPAAARVAQAEAVEMDARRRSIAGSSQRRLDVPAGDAAEMQPSRTMRTLSRLINASKRTFSSNALQPVSIH